MFTKEVERSEGEERRGRGSVLTASSPPPPGVSCWLPPHVVGADGRNGMVGGAAARGGGGGGASRLKGEGRKEGERETCESDQ